MTILGAVVIRQRTFVLHTRGPTIFPDHREDAVTVLRTSIVLVLIFGFTLAGCDLLEGSHKDDPVRALTAQEKKIVESETTFGLQLFRAVAEEEPHSNVFLSPLSVSMALGMTMNGADSTTYDAMKQTLGVGALSEPEINEAYRTLIDLLTALDSKVTFQVANSIWHREEFEVEEPFLQKNREHFDAEVEALDFGNEEAVRIINAWVQENTQDRIEKIVEPPIDPLTMMYLINAIYFQGDWKQAFDPEKTEEKPFTRLDGSTVPVEMMQQEADQKYVSTERAQVVDLAYGDSLFSMTVVLPWKDIDINTLAQDLTADTWRNWIDALETRGVALQMPKLELEYEKPLGEVLKEMGMEVAFSPRTADFSRINPAYDDLHISKVKHKTFLNVDEKGTEAAAVTSVEIGITSGGGGGAIPVRLNRPFLLAIREHHSDTLLFIGKVMDPTA